jgi:uncharacterized membrane protein
MAEGEAMAANPLLLSLVYAVHMLATVVWIGGLIYQSIFLLPALRTFDEPGYLLERLRTRFQPIAWISLTALVGTGLIQMATHPQYNGFLAIEGTWAKAILFKHVAIIAMVLVGAYQSFSLYPRITRSLLVLRRSGDSHESEISMTAETLLIRLNVVLSIVVLLLTAIARTA